jgi:hypothetical protein
MIETVRSAAGWRPEELTADDWQLPLTAGHRAEVLAAVAATAETTMADLSPDVFVLPTLGPILRGLAVGMHSGRGLMVLRGVPVAELDEPGCERAALGIAAHVGGIAPQGPDQVPLLHVRDQGADPARPTTRSYQHNQRLGYHADPTDMVALLCIRPAKSGGLSSLVSPVTIHNEIVRTRPDLADELYRPWWFDRRSGNGPDSFFQRPVYSVDSAGRLVTHYGPDYMRSAQRGAHVPALTPQQEAALDLIKRLTHDPRFALTLDLQAGDFQFLDNSLVLHSRTGYEDHPEPERRRDLIRLWLTTPE